VKTLAITFEIRKKQKENEVGDETEDGDDEEEENQVEALPDWFEAEIKLVEERVKKKASRRQVPHLSKWSYELILRWTSEGKSLLDFADEKELVPGNVTTGPAFLTWPQKA
jgi:hypothetical protein